MQNKNGINHLNAATKVFIAPQHCNDILATLLMI